NAAGALRAVGQMDVVRPRPRDANRSCTVHHRNSVEREIRRARARCFFFAHITSSRYHLLDRTLASTNSRIPMPRPDDYDDYDGGPTRSSAQFPVGVKMAGIIWIAFGALGLIGQAISLIVNLGQQAAAQGGGGPGGSPFAGVGCGVLFALAFL